MENYIAETDKPILKHVKSLFVEQSFIKPSVAHVKLEFNENEYFTNSVLEYTIRFKDRTDEQIEAIVGTSIDWKSKRKNVTQKKVRKIQKHRVSGQTRTVYAYKQAASFFNIFASREAADCTNLKCEIHKGPEYEQKKVEFANMSKYR